MNTFLETVHFDAGNALCPVRNEKTSERSMSVELHWERPEIKINYWHTTKRERAHTTVKTTEESYLAWLRVLFAVRAEDEIEDAIAVAASLSGYPLKAKNIKIESIELG